MDYCVVQLDAFLRFLLFNSFVGDLHEHRVQAVVLREQLQRVQRHCFPIDGDLGHYCVVDIHLELVVLDVDLGRLDFGVDEGEVEVLPDRLEELLHLDTGEVLAGKVPVPEAEGGRVADVLPHAKTVLLHGVLILERGFLGHERFVVGLVVGVGVLCQFVLRNHVFVKDRLVSVSYHLLLYFLLLNSRRLLDVDLVLLDTVGSELVQAELAPVRLQ